MKLSKSLSNTIGFAFILLGLSGAYLVSRTIEKPSLFITKQQSSFNIDNNFFAVFNLGQKRLYSSLLWIATILESDHDHYKGRDLNSWMYLRFLTISNLEPKFLKTYTFGGPYLSIIKDDLEGASVIYDKGLAIYPNEFDLLNNAAFHYQFEKIDRKKAYDIYKKLNTFPNAGLTIVSQYARLESEHGNLATAFQLLSNIYEKQEDKGSFLAKRIRIFLYAIKAEQDLKCLNSKQKSCLTRDLNNEPYVKKDGVYFAQTPWAPYKTKAPLHKQEGQ